MNVLAEFFNGFVINGFYFLRQQCSNDAIVQGAEAKLHPLKMTKIVTNRKFIQ